MYNLRIFFSLETKSRHLMSNKRHALYDYLASFLPCSKDTLMKRAKKLLMEEEERQTIEPFKKYVTSAFLCIFSIHKREKNWRKKKLVVWKSCNSDIEVVPIRKMPVMTHSVVRGESWFDFLGSANFSVSNLIQFLMRAIFPKMVSSDSYKIELGGWIRWLIWFFVFRLKASIEKIMPTLMDNYTAACQQAAEEK